ncbi:type IV secretory system conjugative DNA transfer family protein [Natronoglycomyces albus]|uniref:Type IV secretory system conjugative DNA transfer family protein n=1 Tax=Natronoglycomyces albus TaxID=2811108 RepID=A0A895XUW6_9ACTN|nr:TraM recognition domain-containing protein [Natronoglycomyces albus]QSB07175.1 type IV secretory system conjugative DNA transfer family protein [Natronoglycomyces albus]
MSEIKSRGLWREVRYPATLATAAAVALQLLAWLIFSAVWLLALPPVTVAGVVVYRTRLRSAARVHAEKARQMRLRGGWATPLDMVRTLGYVKMFRQMKVVRPSLATLSFWERLQVPFDRFAVRLVRIQGWLGRRWLYVSIERMTAIIAQAGTGKTGWLANILLDAKDNPVVVTSMKVDLIAETKDLREEVGPVDIFNPDTIGGPQFASTIKWDMLAGCKNPQVAQTRAGYLMAGAKGSSNVGDAEFWKSQGVRILGIYLHAAALGGLPVAIVSDWVGRAKDSETMQDQLRELISQSPQERAMMADLEQWLGTNANTATSTTTTITNAVKWLSTDAANLVDVKPGKESFDIDRFLSQASTLYLLAEEKDYDAITPLFTAFVGWLYDETRKRASQMPKGRLEPHLTMVLDELATICPVPMNRWAPVMRGFNISAHIGLQSIPQLEEKYGKEAAKIILDNVFAKMYLGGITDTNLLKDLSLLFGEVSVTEYNPAHQRHDVVRRPVLAPDRIRDLDIGEALLVVTGLSGAATGRITPYWERKDYKALQRQKRKDARKQRKIKSLPQGTIPKQIEKSPSEQPQASGHDQAVTASSVEQWMATQRDAGKGN